MKPLDKIIDLEVGADDYLVKPLICGSLARIHALMRRLETVSDESADNAWLQYEDLLLDREKLLLFAMAKKWR